MSTRGAYGFRLNNKDYISYNHSDSYPNGLGEDILKQTKELLSWGIQNLVAKVGDIRLVNDGMNPNQSDIENLKKYTNLEVGNQSEQDWYCLTRGMQGDLIANVNSGYIVDNSGFLLDSLFCEYAYIINLDENLFEVYRGFVELSGDGRYDSRKGKDGNYYGVKLIWTFPLDQLPNNLGVLSITE